MAINSPISFLYNKFSRKAKNMRKYKKMIMRDAYLETLAQKYNKAFVSKITGIVDPEALEEFMSFCMIRESFIETALEYELALAIKSCHVQFIQDED